jgi:hypothetical protein
MLRFVRVWIGTKNTNLTAFAAPSRRGAGHALPILGYASGPAEPDDTIAMARVKGLDLGASVSVDFRQAHRRAHWA